MRYILLFFTGYILPIRGYYQEEKSLRVRKTQDGGLGKRDY